jgi:hypothetical protein
VSRTPSLRARTLSAAPRRRLARPSSRLPSLVRSTFFCSLPLQRLLLPLCSPVFAEEEDDEDDDAKSEQKKKGAQSSEARESKNAKEVTFCLFLVALSRAEVDDDTHSQFHHLSPEIICDYNESFRLRPQFFRALFVWQALHRFSAVICACAQAELRGKSFVPFYADVMEVTPPSSRAFAIWHSITDVLLQTFVAGDSRFWCTSSRA